MQRPDIIFLHAPTILDFRQRKVLYGPISDVVPSTPVFEMYPLGFAILTEYLRQHGLTSRIVNMGIKLLLNPRLQPEDLIRKLDAPVFGIDLHWMPHAHGALEAARLVKKHHPQSKVLFGGLSSTHFHEELIKYPDIDFVIRGDSTEEPVKMLVKKFSSRVSAQTDDGLAEIPNLTWKDSQGGVHVNPFTYKPDNLDHITLDFGRLFKTAVGYNDWSGYLPFHDWIYYPILAILTCRGCAHNCAICGGSSYSTRRNCHRNMPIFRSIPKLVEDIMRAQGMVKAPVFVFGDMTQMGDERALEFFYLLKKSGFNNEIIIEFFHPPSREVIKAAISAAPNISIEISPHTHDDEARAALGRPYTNAEMERSIADMIEFGCKRLDLFFMTGLSRQTRDSVRETCNYTDYLLKTYGRNKQIYPYISPLAPFVDPGSRIHDHPQHFGYRLLTTDIEGYRRHMQAPTWKHMLNYETKWMSRNDISDATYDSALELLRLKAKYGLTSQKEAGRVEARIIKERKQMEEIDNWCTRHNLSQPESLSLHEDGYGNHDLNWDKSLFGKSTCNSEELNRTLWLFKVIPFPKFIRRATVWFWKAILKYYGGD